MRCASSAAIGSSSRTIVAIDRPQQARDRAHVVDLPAPLAPISATISPGRTSKRHVLQHRRGAVAGGELARRSGPASRDPLPRRGARPRAHLAVAEIGLEHLRIAAHLGGRAGRDRARRRRARRRGRRCPSPAVMSCSTRMTAMPRSAMRRSSRLSASLSARIRPAAGSSSSSTRGRMASARAISTRRRSTCGRSPAGVGERARDSRRRRAAPRAARRSSAAPRSPTHAAEPSAAQRDQHVVEHAHACRTAWWSDRCARCRRAPTRQAGAPASSLSPSRMLPLSGR